MSGAIDAVLFDFGGVFTASPFRVFAEAGRALGAAPGQIEAIMFGPYDEDTDHPWHRLERGEISLVAAREAIMAEALRQRVAFDPLQVLAGMGSGSDRGVRTAIVERARRVRAEGRRTALVTNNVAEFDAAWRSLVPVEELFDVVVDSSAVGVRKPDPAIFHLALSRLGGVPPARAVFLDDFEGNVAAAESLGLRGLLVGSDDEDVIAQLDRLLGG